MAERNLPTNGASLPTKGNRIGGRESSDGPRPQAAERTTEVPYHDDDRILKSKSAILVHRELLRTLGTLSGGPLSPRGCCISTVGLDEAMIQQ